MQNTGYASACCTRSKNRCIAAAKTMERIKTGRKKMPRGILLLPLSAFQLAAHYKKTQRKRVRTVQKYFNIAHGCTAFGFGHRMNE